MILESSNVPEILLIRCFDHVLHQRIMWVRALTQNEHARFTLPKSPEGSASALSYDLRAPSEAGSARLSTPTQDETPLENIIWTWEGEFHDAHLEPQVPRVIGLMTPGGNLSSWKDSFRSVSRDPKDPEDIHNWSWKRFCDELYVSTMYSPPDKKKLLEVFTSAKCQEPGTPEQITAYTHAFTLAFQELRRHHLDKQYSIPVQAQMYYNNLPKLVKHHMSLYDPKRKDSDLREDLSALRQEVREVMAWPIYKDAVSQATNGRAMVAMGVLVSGDPDKRPKHIEAQQGEIARSTTATTTQSTA